MTESVTETGLNHALTISITTDCSFGHLRLLVEITLTIHKYTMNVINFCVDSWSSIYITYTKGLITIRTLDYSLYWATRSVNMKRLMN